MVSVTSSSTAFSMDVDDIINTALEALGGEHISAGDSKKARMLLNIILIELQNKNIPLNKIDTVSTPLVDGTATYTFAASIVDVLEGSVKDVVQGTSIPLSRYGVQLYHNIPNKTTEGRPTLFKTDRKRDAIEVTVWPVPDASSTWTLETLVYKKIEDVTASYQRVDLPYRYLPLLTKWLAYEFSLTKQGIPDTLIDRLKMRRDEAMPDTFEEDRERVDLVIVPGGISGR